MRTAVPLLLCLLLYAAPAAPLDAAEPFPAWGASPGEVLDMRRPRLVACEESRSLLFPLSVYAVLTQEQVHGRPASVLYGFSDGALLEYAVSFHGDCRSLYAELKAGLQASCRPYRGPYFPSIDDAFINENEDTLYLLLPGREAVLYALDMRAYARHVRPSAEKTDDAPSGGRSPSRHPEKQKPEQRGERGDIRR